MSVANKTIKTSHADVAISESSGSGIPVLFIHGNSSCKEVFRPQMASAIAKNHRVIAMDLPGHGASSDAFKPERTYTMSGYADAAVEVLDQLGVSRAVVCGWSLGGHVAMEMLPRFSGMAGLLISSAPPVARGMDAVMAGFQPIPQAGLAGKPDFTEEEAGMFFWAIYGGTGDAVLENALKRTDGRARAIMFQNLMTGGTSDQKTLAENSTVPIAIVNGADDPIVNTAYIQGLKFRTLWDNHCYLMRGAGHAPLWQVPENANPILGRFVDEMAARPAKGVHGSRVVAA